MLCWYVELLQEIGPHGEDHREHDEGQCHDLSSLFLLK